MLYEMSNQLFNGDTVALDDMLSARERRSFQQAQLLQEHASRSLLCVTLNIPGPVKNSASLTSLFKHLMVLIREDLAGVEVLETDLLALKTGCEYYLIANLSKEKLKERMIGFEQGHPLGRLLDLDVLSLEAGQVQPVSRTALGYPPRQCYLCQEEAKVCGRMRKHDVLEMQGAIAEMVSTYMIHTNFLD